MKSASSTETTHWFPASISPVRYGVYERDMRNATMTRAGKFSFWNGSFWGGWGGSIATAEANKNVASSVQGAPWRGLAREPK